MFYKNARIFCSDFRFHTGAFEVVDGKFGAVLPENVPEDAIDLGGATGGLLLRRPERFHQGGQPHDFPA